MYMYQKHVWIHVRMSHLHKTQQEQKGSVSFQISLSNFSPSVLHTPTPTPTPTRYDHSWWNRFASNNIYDLTHEACKQTLKQAVQQLSLRLYSVQSSMHTCSPCITYLLLGQAPSVMRASLSWVELRPLVRAAAEYVRAARLNRDPTKGRIRNLHSWKSPLHFLSCDAALDFKVESIVQRLKRVERVQLQIQFHAGSSPALLIHVNMNVSSKKSVIKRLNFYR